MALLIIAATVVAFTYYIKGHPETIDQLQQLPPATILVLLLLNSGAFLAYVLVTRGSLHVYGKTMSVQENILFNAYSSLINFFGPGQSGPIFRAAYLKKRHHLAVKNFTLMLLVYLGFYALISALFVVVGLLPWWLTVLFLIVGGAGCVAAVRYYKQRSKIDTGHGFNVRNIGWVLGATALQLVCLAIIYGVELRQTGTDASLGQILSYTGVSNFSLFVALTPGAIGIREAFLVFSQNLHHIDNTSIVAANILDRAVYLLFLGILFVMVIALHAKDKLNLKQLKTTQNEQS